jgi:predicted metal-binding protein
MQPPPQWQKELHTSLELDVSHVLTIIPLSEVTENESGLMHYVSIIWFYLCGQMTNRCHDSVWNTAWSSDSPNAFHFISCLFMVTGQGGSYANTSDLYSGSAQFNSWLWPQLYYTEVSRCFLRSASHMMRHCHKYGQTTSFHAPYNLLFANHPTIWCLQSQLLAATLHTP